jgi:hypothetical protein
MLTEPRAFINDEKYFPYINPDSSTLNLEGELIKSKYNQRYKTNSSPILINSINYLNSMKFRINKKMLKFVLNE